METLDKQKVLESILAATRDVFATMMGLEIVAEPPYDEPTSSGTVDGVVALIGLAGHWVGGGVIQCDANLARKLYTHFLMTEAPAGDEDGINAEILDAMAEIANMIIGNVKNDVEQMIGTIGMGIPTVVFGRNFTTPNSGTDWMVVPFTCDGAHILVKFCLNPPSTPPNGPAEIEGRDQARMKRVLA